MIGSNIHEPKINLFVYLRTKKNFQNTFITFSYPLIFIVSLFVSRKNANFEKEERKKEKCTEICIYSLQFTFFAFYSFRRNRGTMRIVLRSRSHGKGPRSHGKGSRCRSKGSRSHGKQGCTKFRCF